MNILISSCLLGTHCRFDGKSCHHKVVGRLICFHRLIPICPEIYGGLPTPRAAAEIVGDNVMTIRGDDVTVQYEKGAIEALRLAKLYNCEYAILRNGSPSCGSSKIYDGTFSDKEISGMGKTAQLLSDNGITVMTPDEVISKYGKIFGLE